MKKLKKKPLQIYIDSNQDKILQSLVKSMGKSKAEIIRLCIDKFLSDLSLDKDPAMEIIGLGRSGKGDLARNHDIYLASYTKSESE